MVYLFKDPQIQRLISAYTGGARHAKGVIEMSGGSQITSGLEWISLEDDSDSGVI